MQNKTQIFLDGGLPKRGAGRGGGMTLRKNSQIIPYFFLTGSLTLQWAWTWTQSTWAEVAQGAHNQLLSSMPDSTWTRGTWGGSAKYTITRCSAYIRVFRCCIWVQKIDLKSSRPNLSLLQHLPELCKPFGAATIALCSVNISITFSFQGVPKCTAVTCTLSELSMLRACVQPTQPNYFSFITVSAYTSTAQSPSPVLFAETIPILCTKLFTNY